MISRYFFISTLILAAIAVVGLLIAQMKWFDDAHQLKANQFDDKVLVLLNQVGLAIENEPEIKSSLISYLHSLSNDSSEVDANSKSNLQIAIREVMDSVFLENGIDIPSYYSIFWSQDCEDRHLVLSDPNLNATQVPLTETNQSLACFLAEEYLPYFLDVQFPDKRKYIFKQSSGLLNLSILFIILLLTSFFAMIYMFVRQRKISEIKNDFINNLTHEFKTPVASIALASKVIQKSKNQKIGDEEMKCLRLITNESKKLETNIDKVLQLASVDAGNFALEYSHFDLHNIIANVVLDFELILKEKSGRIKLKLAAGNSLIHADKVHLRNLLHNLIDNAIKYSDKAPDIEISTNESSEGLLFCVKDHGIGMNDEIQSQIFKKFYRASNGSTNETRGFGLGLSYVKSIVDAHKGRILFTSKTNLGTEFLVVLPRK